MPLPVAWAWMNSDGLDEHAGGAAAGVVDAAFVGLEHFDQQPDDGARGVELAALAALGQGELLQEVLVDAAEDVRGAGLGAADLDVADHVDDLAEAGLVQGGPGVVLGQHVLEGRVVLLDGGHGVVDGGADGGLVGLGLQDRPAGVGRHPEDVLGDVLVPVLGGCSSPHWASTSCAWRSSKASEMYLRKMRPRTTCLYSAASMLPRRASAMLQSWAR